MKQNNRRSNVDKIEGVFSALDDIIKVDELEKTIIYKSDYEKVKKEWLG